MVSKTGNVCYLRQLEECYKERCVFFLCLFSLEKMIKKLSSYDANVPFNSHHADIGAQKCAKCKNNDNDSPFMRCEKF